MSQSSFSLKFYVNENRSKEKGYPIYGRITVDRKKAEFFTQHYSPLLKWDEQKQRVKGNVELNAALASIESKITKLHQHAILAENFPTANELKDAYLGKDITRTTLLDYFDQFQAEIKELPDQYTIATVKKYTTIRTHLETYLDGIRKRNILINDFKLHHINEFEFHLRSNAKLNINTTTKYLKQLKAVINRGIQYGIVKESPFLAHKFKNEKTHRTFLTKDELESLEKLETINASLERVRDCFLFSCNTGIRFSDLSQLSPKHVHSDKAGNTWLSIRMQKTGEPLRVPLTKKAKQILEKYTEYAESTNQLLPMISNQKLNAYLKVLADLSGIQKLLTFHVARHTFATTVTLSNEIPLEVVSKLLGHTSVRTTQIYAKITNDYLLESINKLNQKL